MENINKKPFEEYELNMYCTAIKVYPMLYSILKETPYSIKDVKEMLNDPYTNYNYDRLAFLYHKICEDVRQLIPNKEYILI